MMAFPTIMSTMRKSGKNKNGEPKIGNRYFYKNGQLYSDKQEQTNKTMSSS